MNKVSSNELVTVVVPSFNQGGFIANTIDSILNQTHSNIEIIVVDGGSTDSTIEVLKSYGDKIKWFSEKDNGQSDAINKGFRLARGSIVSWLNSDDIYVDKNAVKVISSEFRLNQKIDLIYGNFIEIDSANKVTRFYKRPSYSFSRLLRIGYISQPATFFRRGVIDIALLREDLEYALDLEFWLRLDKLNFGFKNINLLIAAERVHSQAKCVRDNSLMVKEAREVRQSYGANFNWTHKLLLTIDRLLLYIFRLSGILSLITYIKSPEKLTIPLNFDEAIFRTLLPWQK